MTWLLLLLAAAPFLVKTTSLVFLAQNYLAQSAYKILQLAAPLWWRRTINHCSGRRCLWPTDEPLPRAGTWTAAVVIATVAVLLAMLCVPPLAAWLEIDPHVLRRDFDARFNITPWRAVAVVLFLSTLNAALEELHFRAWLDPELSRRFGNGVGILGSALTFAAMHLLIFAKMQNVTAAALGLVFVALVAIAVAWSVLARRVGGIHAAWLSHALTDAGLLTWGLVWLGYF